MPLLYQPNGRAREYSQWALNIYRGCGHLCTYCYVPNATVTSREAFHRPEERRDFLAKLEKEAAAMKPTGDKILLCFSCDPYQPIDDELQHTRKALQILKKYGHNFQILTKGGKRALRDLDLYGPGDAFASTLTLIDPGKSEEWEGQAASPQERMDTLKAFHAAGVETWVSLEPVLNPASALEIIRRTHEYVDLYKVGKLNYQSKADPRANALAEKIDWAQFANDAISLLEGLGKRFYIKDDLAKYVTAKG